MSDETDRILQRYMETLVRLQRDRQNASLSQEELRQIAIDSGMSEEDLEFIHQRFIDFLNRGQGFLKYENWDGAITELEEANALEPNNTIALNALAVAHWRREGEGDIERARGYANQVLRIDSMNDPALRLMSAIQKGEAPPEKKKPPGKGSRAIVLGATIVALGVILALALRMGKNKIEEPRADTVVVMKEPKPADPVPEPPEPVPVPPADTGIARLVKSFGEEGIGAGMFQDARSIAVDGAGNIYVSEYSDGRIQAFDSSGKYLTQWNIGKNNYGPDLAADRNGILYIVRKGAITKYNGATGEEIGLVKYAGGNKFQDVSVTPDGGLVASWNSFEGANGVFVNPKIVDELVVFDPRGKVVRKMTKAVSEAADGGVSMSGVRVAMDGLGMIYAASGSAIYKFSPEGKFITRVGSSGNKPGQFSSPGDIAVDGKGRIYVCDMGGVYVYDSDGLFLGSIDQPGAESGIAVDDHGGVYFVNRTKVYHYIMK